MMNLDLLGERDKPREARNWEIVSREREREREGESLAAEISSLEEKSTISSAY